MTLTETTVTAAYQKVVSSGEDYILQNTGNSDLYLLPAGSAPADSQMGFILKPLDAMNADIWGDSDWYVRLRFPTNEGKLSVAIK